MNKISIEHLLDLIDSLPKNKGYDYVIPGKIKAVLLQVNRLEQSVDVEKMMEDGSRKSAGITPESLSIIADAAIEGKPFSVDSIFNGSGSARSTWEALIANTTEFYWCKVNNKKHLVWFPNKPHSLGAVSEIDSADLPDVEVHFLEPSVSNYITQFDSKTIKEDDLVKLLKRAVDAAPKDALTLTLHDFAIRYATHIDNCAQLATKVWGSNSNSAVLSDGKKIGLYYRGLIERNNIDNLHVDKLSSSDKFNYDKYLRALRTKPFLLLAGISGTGKSRIVRELAFKSCPVELRDQDGTTPGNYLMVEVKPNWHDSSELLGYYSHLANNKQGGYIFTDFVKFLVKAKQYPTVPFFVCLDEMNLAPVEQYFAELLSLMETRKKTEDGIKSGVLVRAAYMAGLAGWEGGDLSLPDNVFIIGTVNMDDTTHQFSRKVIDRAMTIEMNGGNLMDMFGGSKALDYYPQGEEWKLEMFQPRYVSADEALEAHADKTEAIKADLSDKLTKINTCLENTPFVVSYRVLNEMVIYMAVLLEDGMDYDAALAQAVDQILLMKILPRIEGDRDLLMDGQTNRLEALKEFAATDVTKQKLIEMSNRLDSQEFTRFWP